MILEFFTNSPQYRNANIANFVLAVPLGIDYKLMKSTVLKYNPPLPTDILFQIY